jgi:protoheme IX farnesyltransferase
MRTVTEKIYGFVAERATAADYAALTKPGLTSLSVATAVGAAALAAGEVSDFRLLATLVGTWLLGGGAGALNQVMERHQDALMHRTAHRPVPAGRITGRSAVLFGVILSIAGEVVLALATGALAACLGAATLLTYLLLYTPLKRLTPFAYVVGGIPGALPPVIGWAAVTGTAGIEAWCLFALLYCWQMPHFLALGWMYRNDYARAAFPMLSVRDVDGQATSRQMVLYAAMLFPAVSLTAIVGVTGVLFLGGASVVVLLFLVTTVRFAFRRTNERARGVFLVSLAALPLLVGFMLLDRLV